MSSLLAKLGIERRTEAAVFASTHVNSQQWGVRGRHSEAFVTFDPVTGT